MNIYSILSNELTTKKIIYAIITALHFIFIAIYWTFNTNPYFITPSLCISTSFLLAFSWLEYKANKVNLRFIFHFHNLEDKRKELVSNFKYLLLITILMTSIFLLTAMMISYHMDIKKNYMLLSILGIILLYGIFEYYRFTIKEIMGVLAIKKACRMNKNIKSEIIGKIGLKYQNLENFIFIINHSQFNYCEVYSFHHKNITISLEYACVYTPKKIPIKTFLSYLKESDTCIESLTAEDILTIEMFSL